MIRINSIITVILNHIIIINIQQLLSPFDHSFSIGIQIFRYSFIFQIIYQYILLISIYNNYIMIGVIKEEESKEFFTQQMPYVIRLEQGQQLYGQFGWFFCVDKTLDCSNKKRSEDTRYPFLHKLNLNITQYNNRWRFEPQHDGNNIYKIIVGGGQFEGHELCCFQDQQNDIRDQWSYYVFAAPYNKFNKYNKWQVEKIGDNIYIVQNTDNKFYLSAHRYYMANQSQFNQQADDQQNYSDHPQCEPIDIQDEQEVDAQESSDPINYVKKDARNSNSTWIMAHKEKRTVVFWKIVPF